MEKPSTPIGMDTQHGKNVNGNRYGQTSWKKRQRQKVRTDSIEKTSTSALWRHSMEKTSMATVHVWTHSMEKTSTASGMDRHHGKNVNGNRYGQTTWKKRQRQHYGHTAWKKRQRQQ